MTAAAAADYHSVCHDDAVVLVAVVVLRVAGDRVDHDPGHRRLFLPRVEHQEHHRGPGPRLLEECEAVTVGVRLRSETALGPKDRPPPPPDFGDRIVICISSSSPIRMRALLVFLDRGLLLLSSLLNVECILIVPSINIESRRSCWFLGSCLVWSLDRLVREERERESGSQE